MSFVVKTVSNSQYKIKVVNQSGALLAAPASVPVLISSAISDLGNYSNTAVMLANDATTYANSVAYTNGKVANVTVGAISDITVTGTPANNSTLVYDTATNKYVVKQIDLDGGNF